MKYVLFVLLLISTTVTFAQKSLIGQGIPNGIYKWPALASDSVLFTPRGCGAPLTNMTAYRAAYRAGALYTDTCGNTLYYYNPAVNAWTQVGQVQAAGNRVFFVEDSLNAQPASPDDSTFWLTGGAPTGASGVWTANANKVLFFAGGVYTVPTQSVSDYAVTTDTVYYHQYNGTTWPRTSPIAWNVGGNPSGGILGSTDASKVRIWYNGNTKILLDGSGVITPPFTGALPGVLGLAANGRWRNVQPGYGIKIDSTIAVDTFKIPTRNTIDSLSGSIPIPNLTQVTNVGADAENPIGAYYYKLYDFALGDYGQINLNNNKFLFENFELDHILTADRNDATLQVYNSTPSRYGWALTGKNLTADATFNFPNAATEKTIPISVNGNYADPSTGNITIATGGGSASNTGAGFRILKPVTQELKTLFGIKEISLDSSSNTNGLSIKFNPATGGVSSDSMLVYNTTDGARVVSVVDYARFILANPVSKQHKFAYIDRMNADTVESYSSLSDYQRGHWSDSSTYNWDLGNSGGVSLNIGNNSGGGTYGTLNLKFANVLFPNTYNFQVSGFTALNGASIRYDGIYFTESSGNWGNNPLGLAGPFIKKGSAAANVPGESLLLYGGDASSFTTPNLDAGAAVVSSGKSVGTGTGEFWVYTSGPSTSGTAFNDATKKLIVTGNGDARYMANYGAFYSSRSLTDKNYVDSVVAAGGGGVSIVSGTPNRITVATGTTTPVIDISASYVGQSSITTLGTITTGVWNGTAIANANLANSSITIAGNSTALGGSVTQDNITGLSSTGLIKRTGANALAVATSNTDYLPVGSPVMTTPTLGVASATSVAITGSAGAGFVDLPTQSSNPSAPATNTVRLFANAGNLRIMNNSTNYLELSTSGFGAPRIATFPNANGTIVYNDNTATITNKDFNSGTNIFPTFNQNTTGSAAKWTTARSIYGNNVDGSSNVTATIAGTYGGTGVNNGSSTITVSGNTSIGSSTNTVAFATTGNTSVTFPTSGTLATVPNSGSGTYSLTPSWSGTAPTGITATYSWIQDPTTKFTTLTITALYSSAGVTNTQLTAVFPPGAPLPITPSGVTGAINDKIAAGYGFVDTGPNGFSPAVRVQVMKATTGSSATTDYMLGSSFGSQSSKYFCIVATYTGQ